YLYVKLISTEGDPQNVPSDLLGGLKAVEANHPEWLMRDRAGNNIYSSDPAAFAVNIRGIDPVKPDKKGLRPVDVIVPLAIRKAKLYGYDGLFLDNVGASAGWDLASRD